MNQIVVKINLTNAVKVITDLRGDGISSKEAPLEVGQPHKMSKDTIQEVVGTLVEAVVMITAIIATITIIGVEDDPSNVDLGGLGDFSPEEEDIYLKQEQATQNIDIYLNIGIYVECAAIKVIMTINVTLYNIWLMPSNHNKHRITVDPAFLQKQRIARTNRLFRVGIPKT